jgi:hypothetical protein
VALEQTSIFSNITLCRYQPDFYYRLTMHHYFKNYVNKMTMLGQAEAVKTLYYGKFRRACLKFIR